MPAQTASSESQSPAHEAVPASDYNYAELAQIYNQARVDYIVPMPMNAKRMQEYVEHYDIDLEASVVARDTIDHEANGIAMLGVREERGWVSRLGVIPQRRRRRAGEFLMHALLDQATIRHLSLIQLEVIKGNEPAIRLFHKLGFEDTREMLVIRRPPGPALDTAKAALADIASSESLSEEQIESCLNQRTDTPSWIEETCSLMNTRQLQGIAVTLRSGEQGWIIFQRAAFQLMHFVMSSNISKALSHSLIAQVHELYPKHDTKIENIPLDHPAWPAYQNIGYIDVFRRIEMLLHQA